MTSRTDTVAAPPGSDDLSRELEQHRSEITAHCYRMLGSSFEAEDAAQEALVRAWRHHDGFDGRSSLRTWLYRIATNVCLDQLRSGKRRATPIDLNEAVPGDRIPSASHPEHAWVQPIPDARALSGDPAEVAASRDTIRLAFIAALQHLPPRQRAILLLRDVLNWSAAEVAELLDTTVAAVNSGLQRAKATLAASEPGEFDALEPADDAQRELLARYVDAFQRLDIDALVAVMHDDAVLTMPPFDMWVRGHHDLRLFFNGAGHGCEGSLMVPVAANGAPALAHYKPTGPNGERQPFAIQVLDIRDGQIHGVHCFLDPKLFPYFGVPETDPEAA
jgi:RNA polymerase sigma-70 factor, ECF subfamily